MSTLATRDLFNAVKRRQAIEKAIAIAAIDQLLAADFAIGVNDGEEITLKNSKDKKAIVNALFTTDEDTLLVYAPGTGRAIGWIHLVYGNDGYDVISDYTTNLEQHLTNATAKAEEFEALIYG